MRRNKKRRFRKILFKNKFVLFSILLFLIGNFVFFLTFYNKESKYISPIPKNYKNYIKANDEQSKKIEILLKKNNILYSQIFEMLDSCYLIKLNSGEEVIVSSKKPIDVQISSLQLILTRLTIEGKRFLKLDFRFDKPIITFK